MPLRGPRCSLPHTCTSPRLQSSLGRSKGCGHSESHTCSTPHTKLGWPQLQTRSLSPRTNTRVKIGKGWFKWYRSEFSQGPLVLGNKFLYVMARYGLGFLGSFWCQKEGASHLPVGSSPSSLRQRRLGWGSPCTSHRKFTGASARTTWFIGLRRNEGRSTE